MIIEDFKKTVYQHYEEDGRKFPWRKKTSPWGIMVSEFMLQQTQVERVIPYWIAWMEKRPDIRDTAQASLKDVLEQWSGLGYNRRAYYLKRSAEMIVRHYNGRVPGLPQNLLPLPGIGPYIAGAIACFAYNHPSVFIETNIRSAVIHFFFPGRYDVKDSEIKPILEESLERKNPRKWYYALMDYGAAVKKITENPGRRSAHYVRQSPFEGSLRQARGKILKTLISTSNCNLEELHLMTKIEIDKLYRVLIILKKEGLITENGGLYRIVY